MHIVNNAAWNSKKVNVEHESLEQVLQIVSKMFEIAQTYIYLEATKRKT